METQSSLLPFNGENGKPLEMWVEADKTCGQTMKAVQVELQPKKKKNDSNITNKKLD
jgi:uracil-DNA glycosylase